MHDHPSTWDYDSDQLAEELAAYAKDLSLSRSKVRGQGQTSNHKHPPKDSDSHRVEHDADEQSVSSQEFITETFIRVPIGSERGRPEDDDTDTDTETNHNNIGLLVISDEDQETWQAFADDGDSDTEWDEEDPDSNGMSCISTPRFLVPTFWSLRQKIKLRIILRTTTLRRNLMIRTNMGMELMAIEDLVPMTNSTT